MKPKNSRNGFDVVVLGGINTDFVIKGDCLPQPGQTVTGESFYSGPGGKGANQAVAAARLGAKVAIIGCVGADARGHELVDGLESEGVEVGHVTYDRRRPTGAAIIAVDRESEKQISVAPGANMHVTLAQIEDARDLIASARVLLMQLEVPMHTVIRAAKIARKHGVKVILDPAPPRKVPKELLLLLHVIRPNRDEAEQITQRKIRIPKEVRRAAKILLNCGVKTVAMEAGGHRGDLVISRHEEILVPRFEVKSVDSTGAGDAYAGAFAAGLAEGLPLQEIARLASATAALKTTKVGAQAGLPTREEVESLLKE